MEGVREERRGTERENGRIEKMREGEREREGGREQARKQCVREEIFKTQTETDRQSK